MFSFFLLSSGMTELEGCLAALINFPIRNPTCLGTSGYVFTLNTDWATHIPYLTSCLLFCCFVVSSGMTDLEVQTEAPGGSSS